MTASIHRLPTDHDSFGMVTESDKMHALLDYALRVARTPYPVLILGETGTGKELMARGIHAASGRSGKFIPLNCGAIPDNILEAELFGAKRGAYTGLDRDRPGMFRLANNGTLFLDEIAELPATAQAKLLRVLQDGEIRPLGGTETTRVHVRVIAATHQNLDAMVADGRFRPDLFFRLSAARVEIPALRDRVDDLHTLLEYAVAMAAQTQGVRAPTLDSAAVELVERYGWPGNVRELLHVVAAALLNAAGEPVLKAEHFPIVGSFEAPRQPLLTAVGTCPNIMDLPISEARDKFEREYLTRLVAQSGGNLSEAARKAGTARSTLRDRLRRHGLVLGTTPTLRSRRD